MLHLLDCDIGAGECHGILCGMLCNPGQFDPQLWLQHASGQNDLTPFGSESHAHVMWDLMRFTQQNIAAEDLSFLLLIPDDSAPLQERIKSIAAWCRGFLSGFGLAGVTDLSVLSDDSRDFLKDLVQIARADEQLVADEDSERSFMEISEYIRIGVLVLREETRFEAQSDPPSETLH